MILVVSTIYTIKIIFSIGAGRASDKNLDLAERNPEVVATFGLAFGERAFFFSNSFSKTSVFFKPTETIVEPV